MGNMSSTAPQIAMRYVKSCSSFGEGANISSPSFLQLDSTMVQSSSVASSRTDTVYAIIFIVGMSLSLSSLGVIRLVSRDPICSHNFVKLHRHRNHEVLPT